MTDIQKESQQALSAYRALAPGEKEAFKALANLFIFMYKSRQQEKK